MRRGRRNRSDKDFYEERVRRYMKLMVDDTETIHTDEDKLEEFSQSIIDEESRLPVEKRGPEKLGEFHPDDLDPQVDPKSTGMKKSVIDLVNKIKSSKASELSSLIKVFFEKQLKKQEGLSFLDATQVLMAAYHRLYDLHQKSKGDRIDSEIVDATSNISQLTELTVSLGVCKTEQNHGVKQGIIDLLSELRIAHYLALKDEVKGKKFIMPSVASSSAAVRVDEGSTAPREDGKRRIKPRQRMTVDSWGKATDSYTSKPALELHSSTDSSSEEGGDRPRTTGRKRARHG